MNHELRFAVADAGVRSKVPAQDRGAVIVRPEGLVLVVCDGAGGLVGGARAAERVVGAARALLDRARGLPDAAAWCDFLRAMDAELARDPEAGETTAVVLSVTRDRVAGASAGDSGAWCVTGGGADELTGAQQKTRLGTGRALPEPVVRVGPIGTLVAASDGLWKHAPHDAVVNAARGEALDDVPDALVALARLPTGELPDDVVVLAVR